MTVNSNGSCGSVVDTKALAITEAPTAFAGAIAATCEDVPYTVSDADAGHPPSEVWGQLDRWSWRKSGFCSLPGLSFRSPAIF